MGLFSKKKDQNSQTPSIVLSSSSLKSTPSPNAALSDESTAGSKHSKFKLFKGKSPPEKQEPERLSKPVLPRVLSTENHPYPSDDEEIAEPEPGSDSDYEPHMHVYIPRERTATVSQLSTLMGYCGLGSSETKEGLQKAANEESKRTFSLLTDKYKITRLSPTMNRKDPLSKASIIDQPQVDLINKLKEELNTVLEMHGDLQKQYSYFEGHKTLFQRYGCVKDVIGRGAYGVIKLIDSGTSEMVFAVKELQKRRGPDGKKMETSEKFIERVISEFIISSTLNNKNVVRTVDLMLSLPPEDSCIDTSAPGFIDKTFKVNQVMESSNGGNLFAYLKKCVTQNHYASIDDIDCMIKQIARGLSYMHQHGVAHCDLKLQNILIDYAGDSIVDEKGTKKARMNLKISDFGKSNVFRTAWDFSEQLWPSSSGAIGSEPYMAPEEHHGKKSWSLAKKDCWALGVLILVIYNVRRHYFCGASENLVVATYYDESSEEKDTKAYGSTYLWKRTDLKPLSHKRYKDSVFEEYTKNAMVADYDRHTKKWTIEKRGTFIPIETLFNKPEADDSSSSCTLSDDEGFEESDYELRKRFIYKLLDMNPSTRLSVKDLLDSHWLADVESCYA